MESRSNAGVVKSADGTAIAFRRTGRGPAVLLVHGATQSARDFASLADALAEAFEVFTIERRGRGGSGPHGAAYGIDRECEDLEALVALSGAQRVFGLSSGAIIALETALRVPSLRRVALYEPPIRAGDVDPAAWFPRFERALEREGPAAALFEILRGVGDVTPVQWIPRAVFVPLVRAMLALDARRCAAGETPMRERIPTMRFDAKLAASTAGRLDAYRRLEAEVLLLGGNRSHPVLGTILDALAATLPHVRRVELHGVGHTAAANHEKPQLVASHLRTFFAPPIEA